MSAHIRPEHQAAFEALTSGACNNFALFSCFANGEPAAAIVVIAEEQGEYVIEPLFVSVEPRMCLTDHDGIAPGEIAREERV